MTFPFSKVFFNDDKESQVQGDKEKPTQRECDSVHSKGKENIFVPDSSRLNENEGIN